MDVTRGACDGPLGEISPAEVVDESGLHTVVSPPSVHGVAGHAGEVLIGTLLPPLLLH